jgi:trehalose 6-phosphate synthase/phosphatase
VSAQGERPIVIASNRLPFTLLRESTGRLAQRPSSGGLVTALEPVLRRRGGTWVGWPGIETEAGDEIPQPADYRVHPVAVSTEEADRYYDGFSNGTLWPLFHSFPERASFDPADFATYAAVNERFATAMSSVAREAEVVWIHDYHLMLAAESLRQLEPDSRLAFFLHVPFPPFDLFRLLPWDREILRGLLACDLIGFHVDGYRTNFLDCVERRLGARVDRRTNVVFHGDRAIQVGVFPIGIDFEEFESSAEESEGQPEVTSERLILGVDRLDYTKGIPERIRAVGRLLEQHPEYREQIVFLQIAVPSRGEVSEYQTLKREIDELVGQVNGHFATSRWSPIRYLHRSVPKKRLTALYRDADVCLVTPLRDGMNLVAKEFVASQIADPGVLVLSNMAGAAETMHEALNVNPYNLDEVAESIHRALNMEEPERRVRMEALRRRERRKDVHSWVNSFLEAASSERTTVAPLTGDELDSWLSAFLRRPRIALFLDYDGTLAALVAEPSQAKMTESMRDALERCVAHPDVDVTIVSGRALDDVRAMVDLSGITYAGNHGLEIEGPGFDGFRHEDLIHYEQRTAALAEALQEVATSGAWTEAKGPTLTFHVRRVPLDQRRELIDRARAIIIGAGFQARDAHAALEGQPPIGWDKGRAVLHVLRARYGPDWSERVRVIYAGDDQTDEDAFRFLSGLARTFRIGPADTPTAAQHRIPDVESVRTFVDWIARRPRSFT